KGSRLSGCELLSVNRGLGTHLFLNIDNGKARIIHCPVPFVADCSFYVIRDAMKLLCADDKIDMRQIFQQRVPTGLGHAPKETENDMWPLVCQPSEHSHFSEGLLIRHVPNAARIQKNDVRIRFVVRALVAALDQ